MLLQRCRAGLCNQGLIDLLAMFPALWQQQHVMSLSPYLALSTLRFSQVQMNWSS